MKGVPLNEELYNYIVSTFAKEDDLLRQIVAETETKNFPVIQVSPELGKLLRILIKIINAKQVLEIGTLAGYSAIWMARALPEDGKLTTLEISREHADFAMDNFSKARLGNKIELLFGDAVKSLHKLKNKKFDFVFIDADKTGYPGYFDLIIKMINPGGIIAADNTLRKGQIILNDVDEGTEALKVYNKKVAADPRVESLLIPISDGLTVSWVK